MIETGSLIDGKEYLSTGHKDSAVINPATGETIAREACADEEWTGRIVHSSVEAYRSDAWQSLTAEGRGLLLYRLAGLLEESEELVEREVMDTGKPVSQVREGEIPLAASILRFYAGAADKMEGRVKNAANGSFYLTFLEPYGVVAGILPWNYPLVNVAMKVAPALAAGNAIVVKPSVETPLSAVTFGKLCIEAGLPPGIVNIALGPGAVTGNLLVNHPDVGKISFTGSTSVGIALQKQAAKQMKSINLELGGKNAIIVFEDADLERAANAVIYSAFVNTGQLCVSCSRLLIHDSIQEKFEEILLKKMKQLNIGDPHDPQTHIGPMITQSQYDMAMKYISLATKEGGRILTGGKPLKMPGRLEKGFWLEPTLVTGVTPEMTIAREEIFGPVLSILTFRDEAEAISLSNGVEYGLSGSVWTGDNSRMLRMIKSLHTGIIWGNSMLNGYPQIPVPPWKMSGTGVELGLEGLMAYYKKKSAVLSYDDQTPLGWNL